MTSVRVTGPMLLLALVVVLMLPAYAQTKMFKCILDGHTVYQQTACPVTSQINDAASAPQATSTSAGVMAPRMTKREKAAARAATSASASASTSTPTD
jgi:hypothetical protein